MPWWTWVALAFFAAVGAAGLVLALVAFLSLKGLRARGEALQAAAEELTAKAEALEERLERTQENAERAQAAVDRLQRSLDRLSVLGWALGDARRAVTQLRSGYLRK